MKDILKLIRVKHWIKNFLIFIPLLCSKSFDYNSIIMTIIGYFAFSLSCSFIYIINDIRDIDNDRNDARKKNRPLPSGRISIKNAVIISIIVLCISIFLNLYANRSLYSLSLIVLLIYLVINIMYSFGLKNVAIIDILLLSFGFVLRIYYGACLIDVEVSNWLFLTILSFSLFMGIGKRKKELVKGKNVRKVLVKYTENFLNGYQNIFVALTFMFYSLWAMEQNKYIIYTVVFIFFIFMRYSLLLDSGDEGDPTTIIYKDKTLFAAVGLYGIVFSLLFILF